MLPENIENINICTIIAKNYIASARTLSQSFLKSNIGGKCYVLIIDDYSGYIDASIEQFEIVKPIDLGVSRLQEFCYKYNITELSTAFKPYFLKYLLDKNSIDKIIYLDPDIFITNSLQELYDELDTFDILLTPHLDKDYPDDSLLPDDSHIMKSGIYNLGFIGLRKCDNVNSFLIWWARKLYEKCIIDHKNGYFVDQKFIDLATILFPNIRVITNTGYNVAYWNIHSRKIHRRNNIWMCNEGLLYFFHFSNFDPENAKQISGYQNRYSLQNFPELNELFSHYEQAVKQNGYSNAIRYPYSYDSYLNGKKISYIDRKIYRKMTKMHKINRIEDPFDQTIHPFTFKITIIASKITKIIFSLISILFKHFAI